MQPNGDPQPETGALLSFRPFAVVGNCWLQQEVELAPGTTARPLARLLEYEAELEFVYELAVVELGLKPSPDFRSAARQRLEGTEPTALLAFAEVHARSRDEAFASFLLKLEPVCDALAFLTANATTPVAALLVEADDTFRVRFFPLPQRALLYVETGHPERLSKVLDEAARVPEIAGALAALRAGLQSRRAEVQLFHFLQALDVLAATQPGKSFDTRVRRLLKSVGLEPAGTSDPSRDHVHVLTALRNSLAHGKPLEPANVVAYAAAYLNDEHLEIRVRDLVRDVTARLADPSYRP